MYEMEKIVRQQSGDLTLTSDKPVLTVRLSLHHSGGQRERAVPPEQEDDREEHAGREAAPGEGGDREDDEQAEGGGEREVRRDSLLGELQEQGDSQDAC